MIERVVAAVGPAFGGALADARLQQEPRLGFSARASFATAGMQTATAGTAIPGTGWTWRSEGPRVVIDAGEYRISFDRVARQASIERVGSGGTYEAVGTITRTDGTDARWQVHTPPAADWALHDSARHGSPLLFALPSGGRDAAYLRLDPSGDLLIRSDAGGLSVPVSGEPSSFATATAANDLAALTRDHDVVRLSADGWRHDLAGAGYDGLVRPEHFPEQGMPVYCKVSHMIVTSITDDFVHEFLFGGS
jgi:hypothetical protein